MTKRKGFGQAYQDRAAVSARAVHRVLKVACTLTDLAGQEDVQSSHVAEAIQYRSLDRRLEW